MTDALQSPGQPLDADLRRFFEPRFGHDFSRVRVHSDPTATQSARAVDALAYTVRQHIVFSAGAWQPWSQAGAELLAHELVHTVQQGQRHEAADQASLRVSDPADGSERSADRLARQLIDGRTPKPAATSTRIARGAETAATLDHVTTPTVLHRQKNPARPPKKAPDRERETACTKAQDELVATGVEDGKTLADRAATALAQLTFPGRERAIRKHFGKVSDRQIDVIRARYERIRDSLKKKTIICLDHCIKTRKHRIECARGDFSKDVIRICPDFGPPPCEPGVTMLHEGAHNDGARGDIDTDGAYPPADEPEGNAYSYENFAVEIGKGVPDVKLRPKKDVEIEVPESSPTTVPTP